MISMIVSPLVVDIFDTNISNSLCLMDGPWSQLDPYNAPMNYQIFFAYNKPSSQT